ncbi:MAG: hypothetical protein V7L14_19265 [Nostoc sp.]
MVSHPYRTIAQKKSGMRSHKFQTLNSNLKRHHAHKFYQALGFEQHGWSFKCVLQAELPNYQLIKVKIHAICCG